MERVSLSNCILMFERELIVMNLNKKSRLVSLVLTILFGPLGLLYSSVKGAIFLTIIAVMSMATVVGPAVCCVLAVALGDHCTHKHNRNIKNFSELVAGKG